ncbi:MAG: LysM domain-containing protein [Aggregatilineales bacterium]
MTSVRTNFVILMLVMLSVLFSGCSDLLTTPPPATVVSTIAPITTLECENFSIGCTRIVGGVMLQSEDSSQQSLMLADISITLTGTIYVTHLVNTLTIGALEGNTAVSAQNTTRVLQTGMETTLNLVQDSFASQSQPTLPQPYNQQTLNGLPLFRLSRAISPTLISTPDAQTPSTVITVGCEIPEGWAGFYRVQRGDTLSAIAAQYDITVTELQNGNCLANINRLIPDDILRVPAENASAEVTFVAEANALANGDCTTLTWQAEDASLVYFQGEAVANNDSQEVCPDITTIYALLIVFTSGDQIGYTQTITVE